MRFAIGLGRMGLGLGQLAAEHGHQVVGWDPSAEARGAAVDKGLEAVERLEVVHPLLRDLAVDDGAVFYAAPPRPATSSSSCTTRSSSA